jgi:hypothetical protein
LCDFSSSNPNATMTIDTLKLARNLQRHSFTQVQAEGLAEELRNVVSEDVASKADIEGLRAATSADLDQVRREIEALRKDTKADIEALRKDTKADIEVLRKDTKIDIANLKADVRAWMLAQTLLLLGVMVGLKVFG